MIRKMLIAMTLTSALSLGTTAFAAPAAHPSGTTASVPAWHNTVHPIAPGTHAGSPSNGGATAATTNSVPAWHNTVHPIAPGPKHASSNGSNRYRNRK